MAIFRCSRMMFFTSQGSIFRSNKQYGRIQLIGVGCLGRLHLRRLCFCNRLILAVVRALSFNWLIAILVKLLITAVLLYKGKFSLRDGSGRCAVQLSPKMKVLLKDPKNFKTEKRNIDIKKRMITYYQFICWIIFFWYDTILIQGVVHINNYISTFWWLVFWQHFPLVYSI